MLDQKPKLTRNHVLFAFLYAFALQWNELPRVMGIPVDGDFALIVFIALWAVATVVGFSLDLRWHGLLFAFGSICIVTSMVMAGIWIADVGSHARDVPVSWLLSTSLLLALVASSGLVLAVFVRSWRSRHR